MIHKKKWNKKQQEGPQVMAGNTPTQPVNSFLAGE